MLAIVDIDTIIALKDRLAPALMRIAGVRAVGVRSVGLTVYLDSDSAKIRDEVQSVISNDLSDSTVPVHFEMTEGFRAANR